MSRASAVKIPGDDEELPASRAGGDILNNAGRGSANDVGEQHERTARVMAMADAVKRGEDPDLAPPAKLGKAAPAAVTKRKAVINGIEVIVDVPIIQKNLDVEQFGPESRLPKGTPVDKNGMACEGDAQPYGVIGDVLTPGGRLVNRVIPVG